MKRLSSIFVLGLFIILVAFQNDNVGSIEINTEYSSIKWIGKAKRGNAGYGGRGF